MISLSSMVVTGRLDYLGRFPVEAPTPQLCVNQFRSNRTLLKDSLYLYPLQFCFKRTLFIDGLILVHGFPFDQNSCVLKWLLVRFECDHLRNSSEPFHLIESPILTSV